MDAGRAPQPIGQAHLPDQAPDLNWNLWTTATSARLPAPKQSKTRPMPPDDALRLDNRDRIQHRRKQAIEPDEEQSIGKCWCGPLVATDWASQALAWGQEGHSIIAELAQYRLTPRAAAEVARLLNPGQSLASASSWAPDERGWSGF